MNKYKQINIEDLKNLNKELYKEYEHIPNYEQSMYTAIVELNNNGEVIRIVGTDLYIEPEDATLLRDYGWVINELNKAYENGKNST